MFSKIYNSKLHHVCEYIGHDHQLQNEGKIVIHFWKKFTSFLEEMYRSYTSLEYPILVLEEK